jgi:hypothetical protein
MNVAIINDKAVTSLITIKYTSRRTLTQVNCTVCKTEVCAHLIQPSFFVEVLEGHWLRIISHKL